MTTDDVTLDRLARNEAAFRSVNEQVSGVAETLGPAEAKWEFICECSNAGCVATLKLSVGDYEQVRSKPTRFVVASGHEHLQIERVVERHGDYVVVEKIGRAAEVVRDE